MTQKMMLGLFESITVSGRGKQILCCPWIYLFKARFG